MLLAAQRGPDPAHSVGLDALAALRAGRRAAARRHVDWIDALYRVYIAGLGGLGAIVALSALLPSDPLDDRQLALVAEHGPGAIGVVVSLGLWAALRSGGRGGPLALEPAMVAHELGSPLPRPLVLRSPALRLIRFWAFAGACGGVIVGLSARQLPIDLAEATGTAAVAGAAVGTVAALCGLGASGHRWSIRRANLVGGALTATAVVAVAVPDLLVMSPPVVLGAALLTSLPGTVDPVGSPEAIASVVAAVGAVVALAVWALRGLGGLSVEAARRRAGLVDQLRFAVTLQDVRTVVLVRRALTQEAPRTRPAFGVPAWGWLPPPVRRGLRGLARAPLGRWGQLVAAGVVAGLAMAAAWHGAVAVLVVAVVALHFAALDATDALAQEVDHPVRWASLGGLPGNVLLWHLPVAALPMLATYAVATGTAALLVPTDVVTALAPMLVLPVVAASITSGALSAALGAPDHARMALLGPDLMGAAMMARMVLPFALVATAVAPVVTAGHDAAALDTLRVSNLLAYSLFACGFALLFLRSRAPQRS
ncbi:MAG: hypothetical protein JJU45_16375 [Acidimicrobiia bacterium]|nr:hypothetical protein [Acidimicrobiia bacterium]